MTSDAVADHESAHEQPAPSSVEKQNQTYARLGYLFVYFTLAACCPYYSRLLASKGLSSSWVGVVMTAQPLSVLFILPPLAHFADRHDNAGRVLTVCGVLSSAALVIVTVSPTTWIVLGLLMALHFGTICTFTSFFDQRVLSTLTVAQKADWGSTRCFGSIGWGVMAPVTSILVGICGWWVMGVLFTVFYVASVWCYQKLAPCTDCASVAPLANETAPTEGKPTAAPGTTAAAAVELWTENMFPTATIDREMGYSVAQHASPTTTTAEPKEEQPVLPEHVSSLPADEVAVVAPEASFVHILKLIGTRRRLVLLLVMQCIGGIGYTLISTYLFLFLGMLNSPSWLYGLAVTMTVVAETPLFRISERLHEWFSDRQMLVVALLGWSLRVIGYSLLPARAPWLVLFIEPLHGLSFGFLWLSGVHCITRAFPAALSGSSIGFLNAATFGVGPVVGNLIGGWLYDGVGPRALFAGSGLAMVVVTAVYFTLDRMWEAQGHTVVIGEEEHLIARVEG